MARQIKKLSTKGLYLEKFPVKGFNMSLSISAIDYVKTAKNNEMFFKKYSIPEKIQKQSNDEIWDWLLVAETYGDGVLKSNKEDELDKLAVTWRNKLQKQLGCQPGYDSVLGQKLSASQVAAAKALDEFPGNYEVEDFRVGYGGFHFLRLELAKYCGCRYYRKATEPFMGELRFEYPGEWEQSEIGNAARDFFLHSDCDGYFSESQIHTFAEFLRKNHVRSKISQHSTSEQKAEILRFIDFVDRSSKGTIYWSFI